MFGNGIQVGTLWNKPVVLDSTLFITFGIFVLFGGLLLLPVMLAMFCIVFLHEMGHVAAALKLGYKHHGIVLHGLGGAALIEPKKEFRARDEILVALAGPAVNFAFALASLVAFNIYPNQPAALLLVLNVIIGLFNLLPFYPMDGGRVFHSVVAHFTSLESADEAAMWLSRAGGVALIALGLHLGWWMLPFLGAFLIWYAGKDKRASYQTKH